MPPTVSKNAANVMRRAHAFATLFLHRTDQALDGETNLDFLRGTFNKLILPEVFARTRSIPA